MTGGATIENSKVQIQKVKRVEVGPSHLVFKAPILEREMEGEHDIPLLHNVLYGGDDMCVLAQDLFDFLLNDSEKVPAGV